VGSAGEADIVIEYHEARNLCYDACPDSPGWFWLAVISDRRDHLVATFQGPLEVLNRSGVPMLLQALQRVRGSR